jgi:hypothetical protein
MHGSSTQEGAALRIDRSFVGWGLFFVLVGAVPLAVRGGALTDDQVLGWWRLWPLLLVGVGLGLILRKTPLDALGGLLIAVTAGAMLGGLLANGATGFSGDLCGQAERSVSFPTQTGALFETAQVEIGLDCGDVSVTTSAGNGWAVEGEDRTPGGPEISGNESLLVVRSRDGDRGPLDFVGRHATWRIALPADPALGVHAETNAGSSAFDFAGANLDLFELETNAGSAVVDLGAARVVGEIAIEINAGSLDLTLPATSTHGSIELNAGSVALCAPPGVALRIRTEESVITSYDFEGHGLIRDGDTWQTTDYDTAAQRIDLVAQGNAGSFTLDPEEGCGV